MTENLRGRSISAFMWGSLGSLIKLLVQFVAQISLARILGPDQYGLFAMGVIVISFSNFLSDIGIAYGLIQRKEVTEGHVRFVFAWQLVLGTVTAASVALLSQPLATFFNDPRAAMVIFSLAPLCFVQACTAVSLNLLKRAMDFKTIHMAHALSYFVGFVCAGVPLALTGQQVWALVAAWTIQIMVNFALLYGRSRHSLKPQFLHPEGREMTRFGVIVLATNLTNWFIGNIDRVVAARMLSTTAVGLYTTAYNLLSTPTQALMGLLQPVMYSACSKVQGDTPRIRNAYLALLGAITLFVMPIFSSLSMVSEIVVLVLYGQEWATAALVLQPIALAMPLYLIWNISTPILWTNGQISKEFKSQLPIALAWVACSIIAVRYSLGALAWTILGLYVLRTGSMVIAAMHVVNSSSKDVVAAVGPGLLMSIVVAASVLMSDWLLLQLGFSIYHRLLLNILTGAIIYVAALRVLARYIHPELSGLIEQAVCKMPKETSVWVKRLIYGNKVMRAM